MQATQSDTMLVSVREAARLLGISDRSLWSLTQPRGPIAAVRVGARVLYSRETLRRWISEREQAGVAEGVGQ